MICKWKKQDMLFCISDRMLTWGEGDDAYETEPDRPSKVTGFCPANAFCMCTGCMPFHDMVTRATHEEIISNNTTKISEVVKTHADCYVSFRKKQRRSASAESIILGMDAGGAHIYHVTDDGRSVCFNRQGYCAIGVGASSFEEQMSLAKFSRFLQYPDALFLAYLAKRAAEVHPGVGPETDVAQIKEGSSGPLRKAGKALATLRKKFESAVKSEKKKIIKGMAADRRFFLP